MRLVFVTDDREIWCYTVTLPNGMALYIEWWPTLWSWDIYKMPQSELPVGGYLSPFRNDIALATMNRVREEEWMKQVKAWINMRRLQL